MRKTRIAASWGREGDWEHPFFFVYWCWFSMCLKMN
jgi:hypothetical protein